MSTTGNVTYIHKSNDLLQGSLLLRREHRGVLPFDSQIAPLGDGEGVVHDDHGQLLIIMRLVGQRQLGALLQGLHALLDE